MIPVSENFKKEMLNVSRNPKSFVILGDDMFIYDDFDYLPKDGWPPGDPDLISWSIDQNLNGQIIGSFPAKMLTLKVINPNNKYDFENKTLKIFAGFKYDVQDEGETHAIIESVNLGEFFVLNVKNLDTKFESIVTAMDKIFLFEKEYFDPRPIDRKNTPTTLKEYLNFICAAVGCNSPTKDFPLLSNIFITKDPFEIIENDNLEYKNQITFREAISKMAENVGAFAFIAPNVDSLEFNFFHEKICDLIIQNYSQLEGI